MVMSSSHLHCHDQRGSCWPKEGGPLEGASLGSPIPAVDVVLRCSVFPTRHLVICLVLIQLAPALPLASSPSISKQSFHQCCIIVSFTSMVPPSFYHIHRLDCSVTRIKVRRLPSGRSPSHPRPIADFIVHLGSRWSSPPLNGCRPFVQSEVENPHVPCPGERQGWGRNAKALNRC